MLCSSLLMVWGWLHPGKALSILGRLVMERIKVCAVTAQQQETLLGGRRSHPQSMGNQEAWLVSKVIPSTAASL